MLVRVCCADNGEDVQETLADMTGQKTVPQVFIGGHFIGWCIKSLCHISRASCCDKT